MRLLGKYVPQEWLDVLAQVQTVVSPQAILAGGCLRDLCLNAAPKDLDIFVPTDGMGSPEKLIRLLTSNFDWAPNGGHQLEHYDETENELDSYTEFLVNDEMPPVQIIQLAKRDITVWDVINRMDFSICQVGTNGKMVFQTQAFLDDIGDRRFRLIRTEPESNLVQSRKRALQFHERFGNSITIDMSADPAEQYRRDQATEDFFL